MSTENTRRPLDRIVDAPFAVPLFMLLMGLLVILPIAWNFWTSGDVHHLNPMIAEIGPLKPRWYGFAYLMGFLGAYVLVQKLSRDGMLRLHPDRVPDLVLNCCIFGVLVGGRMGYALFYDLPDALRHHTTPMLWNFSAQFPFWGVLKVWDGGMSAHGGVLFTILTLVWFSRRYKVSLINIGDAACMVVPIGLCFGRIANFINGELYGHPASVPWAVKFPSEVWTPTNAKETIPPAGISALKESVASYLVQHPLDLTLRQVQDYLFARDSSGHELHGEFRNEISAKVGGLHLELPEHLDTARRMISEHVAQTGDLFLSDLAHWWERGHSAVGTVMQGVFEHILPARHPSQLYEGLLEGLLLFIICWTIGRLWRKEGMASGAFLTLYPIMRIVGEQFRVGDSPQKVLGIEMSLGVIYSLLMFAGGVVYWAYWIRRNRQLPWVPVPPGSKEPPLPEQGSGFPVSEPGPRP